MESPTWVVIRIMWDSVEGHEIHFTKGPYFEPFISPLRPYLQHIVEMEHYTSIPPTESTRRHKGAAGDFLARPRAE